MQLVLVSLKRGNSILDQIMQFLQRIIIQVDDPSSFTKIIFNKNVIFLNKKFLILLNFKKGFSNINAFPFVGYFKSARAREQAQLKLEQFLSDDITCSILIMDFQYFIDNNITLQLDHNAIIAVQDESQFLTIKEDFNNFAESASYIFTNNGVVWTSPWQNFGIFIHNLSWLLEELSMGFWNIVRHFSSRSG